MKEENQVSGRKYHTETVTLDQAIPGDLVFYPGDTHFGIVGGKKAFAEKLSFIPLTDLYERADRPIRMRDDDSIRENIESLKRSGVLTPGTVHPRTEGGYPGMSVFMRP